MLFDFAPHSTIWGFEQAIWSIKGLKYLTIKNTTYHVLSIGSLLKTLLPFFYQRAYKRCSRNNFTRRHRKGGGGEGPETFLLLANVKFKLSSAFVSVVDGSRFKNIFPQYRRNHALSCVTAVRWCFELKLRKQQWQASQFEWEWEEAWPQDYLWLRSDLRMLIMDMKIWSKNMPTGLTWTS